MSVHALKSRFSRLAQIYGLLINQAFLLFGWRLLLPLLAGSSAIVMQVFSVGLIVLYAKSLLSGETFSILQIAFVPRESFVLLVIVSLLSLIMLTLSAFLAYYSHLRFVVMSCDFEKRCMRDLFEIVSKSQTVRIPHSNGTPGESVLLKSALNDTRACGRAFLMAISSVIPFVTFLFSMLTVLSLNWILTLALVPLFALFVILNYRVNLFGVSSSRNLDKYGSLVRNSFRDTVLGLRNHSRATDLDPIWKTSDQERNLDRYLNSYQGIMVLSYRSFLVNDLFLALTLTLVLFGLSWTAIHWQSNWGIIIAYIVALRYAMSSLKQTSAKLTVMNRFLPQVSRFLGLQKSAHSVVQERSGPESLQIETVNEKLGSHFECQVAVGSPAILYCRVGVTRYNVQEVLDTLCAENISPRMRPTFLIDAAVLENFYPQGFTDFQWIFVDAQSIPVITKERWQEAILEWKDKFVFIHRRDLSVIRESSLVISPETPVIVMSDTNSIVWLGTNQEFLIKQKELIPLFLGKSEPREATYEENLDLDGGDDAVD